MKALGSLITSGLITASDTAFLALDFGILAERLEILNAAFPGDFQHAVAIKTNPQRAVLAFILEQGHGLEAASWEELKRAKEAGAKGRQLVFDSPVKTREEIAWCVQHLPGLMLNVNSLRELERIPENHGLRLGIRINPMVSAAEDALYDVSTPDSKFGVPLRDKAAIIGACMDGDVQGLHMHVGSGAADPSAHLEALDRLLELADEVDAARKAAGREVLSFLNIGGGLAASTDAAGMHSYARAVAAKRASDGRSWVTEFGQWVHAPVGCLASRVEYVRPPEGQRAGTAFLHIGADMLLRQVYHRRNDLKVQVFSAQGAEKPSKKATFNLVGPLCFAGDVLAQGVEVPELAEGDWVVLDDMGANTLGLWSRHCSRAVPKVLAHDGQGHWSCVQERREIEF